MLFNFSYAFSIVSIYDAILYYWKNVIKIYRNAFSLAKRNPIIISIDGNIGSGKSTFIKILKDELSNQEVEFASEPVNIWTSVRDDNGKSLLTNFYEDKDRWSYTFQNFAYITRLMELERAKKTGKKIIITERSVLTDRNVFAKMLNESGHINSLEMNIYKYWYNYFDTNITHTVYLKTSVDNCLTRIKNRGRESEVCISKDYLSELEKEHDNWLIGDYKATILNGNINFVENDQHRKWLINTFKKCIDNLN